MESLRQPTETLYLWVDALCINQQDKQEKSQQVAYMLQIYQRAERVTAWLGGDDEDNTLAFSCINNVRALRTALLPQESPKLHHADCWIQLQAIYTSLTRLYGSGWLCRTWIRQEIYGAGEIVVQSGSQRASWLNFLHAAFLMPRIRAMLSEHGVDDLGDDNPSRINRLVTEAYRNNDALGRSTKAPRNLVEVLMQSADYGVTDEKDTFYAVLGMCDVDADIKENSSSRGAGVVVDYKKSLAEVYRDASAYILGRKFYPNSPYVQPNMAELWHSYKPSKWHHAGLPSWAVDWRSGVMDYEYRLALYKGSFRMVSDDLRSFRVEPCDQRWIWMPLNEPVAFDAAKATGGQQSQKSSDVVTVEGNILRLKAKAINYIAHLTDYTLPVESCLLRQPMWMGWAGRTVHASSDPGRIRGLFRQPSADLLNFDPSKRSWRIGLLGVGNDAQVCLVPSSAEKGDLVIAIAPNVLPMIIRPMGKVLASHAALFSSDGPYERIANAQPLLPAALVARSVDVRSLRLFTDALIIINCFFILIPAMFTKSDIAATILLTCVSVVTASLVVLRQTFVWRTPGWAMDQCLTDSYAMFTMIALTVYFTFFVVNIVDTIIRTPARLVCAICSAAICGMYLLEWLAITCFNIEIEVTRAIRRRAVLATLNRAPALFGEDYRFVGPVFVRQKRYEMTRHTKVSLWFHRQLMKVTVRLNRASNRKPYIPNKKDLPAGMYPESFAEVMQLSGHEDKLFPISERPVHEFRIH